MNPPDFPYFLLDIINIVYFEKVWRAAKVERIKPILFAFRPTY
jgi:hypothetical protein